jgi:hypothetical protein
LCSVKCRVLNVEIAGTEHEAAVSVNLEGWGNIAEEYWEREYWEREYWERGA